MINLIDPNGQPVNADQQHVPDLLNEGYRLATEEQVSSVLPAPEPMAMPELAGEGTMGNVVNLIDPHGQPVNADREHVDSLLADGYQLASTQTVNRQREAEEYGDIGSQVAAGLEGVAQGATAHLYGLGAKHLLNAVDEGSGDQYVKDMALRQEHNAVTEGIGEGIGVVGSLLALPALSMPANSIRAAAAAKAGSAVGARALGYKVAAEALAGAVETGLYSGVSRVSDGLTGDDELDAEAILLGTGKDMLIGGALGGGLAAIGAGIKATGELTKRGISKVTGKGASLEQALDDFADERAFKNVLGSNKSMAKQAAREFKDPNADKMIGRWIDQKGVQVSADAADNVKLFAELEEMAGIRQQGLIDSLDELQVRPNARLVHDAIKSEFAELAAKAETERLVPKIESRLKPMLRELKRSADFGSIGPTGQYDSYQRLWELRRAIDDKINWKVDSNELGQAMKQIRRRVEDAFMDLADDAATRGLADAGFDAGAWKTSWEGAKKDFRIAKFLRQASESKNAAQSGNNAISLRATMGGLAGGNIIGDVIADQVAGGVGSVLGGVGGGILGGLAMTAGTQALARHGGNIMERGARGAARMVRGAQASTANPQQLTKVAIKAQKALETSNKVMRDTLLRGIGAVDFSGRDEQLPDDKRVQQIIQEADQIAMDDGDASERLDDVSEAIARHYGVGLSDALEGSVRARAAFLSDRATKLNATANGRRSLARYINAVENPSKAMMRLAAGTASREDIETIQNLFPRAFADLKQRAVDALEDVGFRPNKNAVQRLKRQFKIGGDPSTTAWLQGIAQSPAQQGGGTQQAPRARGPSAQIGKAMLSPSQAVTSRLG